MLISVARQNRFGPPLRGNIGTLATIGIPIAPRFRGLAMPSLMGVVRHGDPMIHEIDPLKDPRWPELLRRHPDASVFHTRGWLETVYRTYGCKPAVFTTSGPDSDLANGLVLCRMRSWLTGRRLVSLPFSDHCEPLVTGPLDLRRLLIGVQERAHAEGCKYVELRPTSLLSEGQPGWRTSQRFYLHRLDLRPGTTAVFRGFHRDCIQRKIRRAEESISRKEKTSTA
jgi:hypothetical protein